MVKFLNGTDCCYISSFRPGYSEHLAGLVVACPFEFRAKL